MVKCFVKEELHQRKEERDWVVGGLRQEETREEKREGRNKRVEVGRWEDEGRKEGDKEQQESED